MEHIKTNNDKRIAKNTLIMYLRMFIVTLITLFTVRIALNTLGVEDYGIYNVVAGFVALSSFISTSMQVSVLRFYSYAIGEKNEEKENSVFNLSLFIFLVLVLLVIVFAETVGLWFLENKMTIPLDRMYSTSWVYQFAIFSFAVSMISVPYSSLILAHEDMGMYALISLIECVLKLLIVYLVKILPLDSLFSYGLLMLMVVIVKEVIGIVYCRKKYTACVIRFVWNKDLFKSLFSYSGWSLFGSLASVTYNQGNNVLINVFFGPLANAARAVAFQVSNTMTLLSSNLFIVVSPQIIKSHARNDSTYMTRLFYMSSKFSYFLIFIFFLPLILETEYILNLWLGRVTEYMIVFTRLTLISALILSMHSPVTTVIQAVGAVRRYHVVVEPVILLSLPLTYLFFKLGYPAEYTFYITIILFLIAHILRLIVLKSVWNFSTKSYLKQIVLPIVIVTLIALLATIFLYMILPYGAIRFIIILFVSAFLVSLLSFMVAFNKKEKKQLIFLIRNRLKI